MTTLPSLLLLALAANAASLAAEFKRIDTNEDGRVSSSEHEVYARTLFDQMDADVDYKLTVAEIMAAPDKFFRHVSAGAGGLLGATELTAEEKIQRIDANRDGVISRDEHANAATAKFQAMDVNNNGELSLEEFAAGG
jgi:Ca2+-binding EF-hand superfamily protein